MRPPQWVKNLFVLAPLVYAQELFDVPALLRSLAAFVIFCVLAGAVYVLNDLVDVEEDRRHPKKKNRPIPSGQLKIEHARVALVVLTAGSFVGGFLLGIEFLLTVVGYFVLQLAYSFRLKKVAYVDVLCIAAGFELRVMAGAFAAGVPASHYLLIETFVLACFLGLGKRAHELASYEHRLAEAAAAGKSTTTIKSTRKALGNYNARTLDALLLLSGSITVATYGIYTLDPGTIAMFGTRWLVVTTVFMGLGVFRFWMLVRRKTDAESPTDAMLRDPLFLANMAISSVAVLALVYLT